MIEYIKRKLGITEEMTVKSIDNDRFIIYLEGQYFGVYDLRRNTFVD